MTQKIRVFILDDHQGILDGYRFRLEKNPKVEIVGTANYGEDVQPFLAENFADVAILDIQVKNSRENSNPYPIIHLIPRLIEEHPELKIVAISMFHHGGLIKAVMDCGASGYILKDDINSVNRIAEVILTIADGGIHLSDLAYKNLISKQPLESKLTKRQREAMSLCAADPNEASAQLAHRLKIKDSTMRNLLSQAYLNLEVRNRTAALMKARKLGLITPFEEFIPT